MATVFTRSRAWEEGGVSVARVRRPIARKPSSSSRLLAASERRPSFDMALASLVAEAKDELRERRVRLRATGPRRPH